MTNFGYCCINLDLRKKKVTCNRGMIKRTFESKGIEGHDANTLPTDCVGDMKVAGK